ncbi:hypothetical protein MFUL124B02_13585 [Myxococcus fulvus 124B02]|nr:hypothetical protein MFUL124B02_13585 [Myxococcus fulvus 124B02]
MKNPLWTTLGASALALALTACGGGGALPTPPPGDSPPIEEPPAPNPGTGSENPAPVDPVEKLVEFRIKASNMEDFDKVSMKMQNVEVYAYGEKLLLERYYTDVTLTDDLHAELVATFKLPPPPPGARDEEKIITMQVVFESMGTINYKLDRRVEEELDMAVPPLKFAYPYTYMVQEHVVFDIDMKKSVYKEVDANEVARSKFLSNGNVRF